MLASSTSNGDSEMQFSFTGHNPFFLLPVVSPLTLLVILNFFSSTAAISIPTLFVIRSPDSAAVFKYHVYPTFISEAIFTPGSLEQSKLLLDILRIYRLSTRCSSFGSSDT
jgi:hypothetical protein